MARSINLGLILCFAATACALAEPLGPCSRRTALVISETLYNPGPRLDGRNVEFIELYNSNPWSEDLSGYRLTGDISYTFPPGTVINARSFVLVAAVPPDILAAFGIAGALGPYAGNLPNGSGTVRLRNRADHVLLELEYDSRPPWPVLPGAAGHSLVLARPSYGERNPAAWASSVTVSGSPRAQEPLLTDPLRWVTINELVARSRAPDLDYIELFNAGPAEVDLSGCVITDDPGAERFVFPGGTALGSHEYLALDEFILGFGFDAGGETIYLRGPSRGRFIHAVSFEGQAPGVAWGRSPDGATELSELSALTPLAPNPGPLIRDLVINEIMYAPLSGNPENEYVELFNAGTGAVDLTGWEFDDGITFKFVPGTMLPAGGYLVVARQADHLRAIYPHLNLGNCVGNFTGSLSKTGERLGLRGRLALVETNEMGIVTTSYYSFPADEVTYGIGASWGRWAHRGGSSLELTDPRSDNRLAANWAASDETQKSAWTNATFTGAIDHVNPAPGMNTAVQLLLLDPGEALVDDVVARQTNGPNVVGDAGFENGTTGWAFQGSTEYSVLVPEGFTGVRALDLRADGPGDPTANRVISSGFSPGLTGSAALGVAARWLRGSPELLVRLSGGGLEMPVTLPVPPNLGTPGQPNSRLVTNAPPAISAVAHTPILPSPSQFVVVTARVQDPDGVTEVWLDIEPPGAQMSVPMWDDGMGEDARAGDGVHSATIPPQPSGTLVGFRIRATDGVTSSAIFPPVPGTNRPTAQCLVRFGEVRPSGSVASYHLWITTGELGLWGGRPPTHNGWLGATFAYGTNRVFYNIGARYPTDARHADAWRSGPNTSLRCDYALRFDADDPFLGNTEAWITMPGEPVGTDATDRSALREHLANYLLESLGLPVRPRRPVHFFLNGNQRSLVSSRPGSFVMEDVMPVQPDSLGAWYGSEPAGELIDIDEWAEANPAADTINFLNARLTRATTVEGGLPVKKLGAYRWSWRRHALSAETMANGPTNFFKLVDAVSPSGDPNSALITDVVGLETQADVEQWMRLFALEHLIGNRHSYGYTRGRRLHAYRDSLGRYELLSGDVDQGFSTGGNATAPLFEAEDPRVLAMWNTPAFARYYWQALNTLLQGPFNNTKLDPILDARASALTASNIDIDANQLPVIKSWIANRRAFVFSQIPSAPFTVNQPTNITTVSNLVTLTGTGPTTVYQIFVGGVAYTATWTTLTNWTLRIIVPSTPGQYSYTLAGVDRNGVAVTPSTLVYVNYVGPPGVASSSVIFSEILFQPLLRRAGFIELMNTNALVSFDLSNWRVNGVEFTFPPGAYIASGQRLVLVQDREAFTAAYGPSVPVAGVFPGELDPAGEVLTLIEPGSLGNDMVADRVYYRTTFPWPMTTSGVALQLADPAGDNARPYNWRTNLLVRATPGAPNSIAATIEPVVPTVWLNEAQLAHPGSPSDDAGDSDPWVELFNPSNAPVFLAGLYLSDTPTNLTRWQFPDAILLSFETLLIWCDGEPSETTGRSYHTSFRLQSNSPYLILSRMAGGVPRVLDFLDLSSAGTNVYGSFPDGQPFFRYGLPMSTPTLANAPVPLFINEWMANNSRTLADPSDNDFDDWFEIYNPNDGPVDLGRFQLRDSDNNANNPTRIAGGTTIPARGHLLVWADNELGQNSASRADLHTNFRLGAGGDRIELRAPDIYDSFSASRIVDLVIFGGQTTDVSGGRYPDGGLILTPMRTATPRGPNSLPRNNSPPVLDPLPDRVVTVGQTLSFPVTATDPEVPPQQFQFSLLAPVPAGATIDPMTGAYSWAPAAEQAGLTHAVSVQVTDNGTPQLGAADVFSVMVLPQPRLTGLVAEPNGITATFQLNSGHNYQVEFREELGAGAWMPLGDPFLATVSVVTTSLPRGPGPQRFYRVVQLD